MAIAPVGGTTTTPAATDADPAGADADLQQAFSDAILRFGVLNISNMAGDIQEACNDTTSNPDAPS